MMSVGFIGVYVVGWQYEQNDEASTVQWVSDSNMEFQNLDTSLHTDDLYMNLPNPYGIGSFKRNDISGVSYYYQNNCTPIYVGNNTWQASMIGWEDEDPDYIQAWYHFPIMIPEANTFIADTITISMRLPGDLHQTVQILLGANNNPEADDLSSVESIQIYPVTLHASETWFNQTFTLSMYQKLLWYSQCQNHDEKGIWIYIANGAAANGLSSYAAQMELEVTGRPVNTWSLQDTVNVVIGMSVGLNIAAMLYMSDDIDFGGVSRKDLHRGGAERSRRKER
jgi:hypothetical protein